MAPSKINNVALLIPAYQPGSALVHLVSNLVNNFETIIIINDGSDSNEAKEALSRVKQHNSVKIINHDVNKGKGAAIKTGIAEALSKFSTVHYFVTADADGQHKPEDILKIALSLLNHNHHDLILGARKFERNTPLKSYIGNKITSKIFKIITIIQSHNC